MALGKVRDSETVTRERERIDRRKRNIKIGSFITALVVVIGLLFMSTNSLSDKNQAYEQRREQLEQQIQEQLVIQEQLEERKKYVQTKKYIEEMAKVKLGLVYPDEIIFKPVTK